jgi:hypothetical protein
MFVWGSDEWRHQDTDGFKSETRFSVVCRTCEPGCMRQVRGQRLGDSG